MASNQGEVGLKLEGVASSSTHRSVVNLVVIQSDVSEWVKLSSVIQGIGDPYRWTW